MDGFSRVSPSCPNFNPRPFVGSDPVDRLRQIDAVISIHAPLTGIRSALPLAMRIAGGGFDSGDHLRVGNHLFVRIELYLIEDKASILVKAVLVKQGDNLIGDTG